MKHLLFSFTPPRNILLILFLFTYYFPIFSQMNSWSVPSNEWDFADAPPSLNQLPNGVTEGYHVSNGITDENGNWLFYLIDEKIFNSSGVVVGNLSGEPLQHELAIVPVPGGCENYCIFYLNRKVTFGLDFRVAEVQVSNGNVNLIFDQQINQGGDYIGGNDGGIAVSKRLNPFGDRQIYVVGYGEVRRYSLTTAGLDFNYELLSTNSRQTYEAEFFSDEKLLAWSDFGFPASVNIIEATLPPFAQTVIPLPNGAEPSGGCEFSRDGRYLYTTANDGIYRIDLQDFPLSYNIDFVQGSEGYTFSQLERGKDNNIYAAHTNNRRIGIIDGNGGLSLTLSPLNLTHGGSYPLTFPDQVDGDNYDDFFGIPTPVVNGLTINDTPLNPGIPPQPLEFYNCAPINLEIDYSGIAAFYQIQVYSVDPLTGLQLSGPGFLDFNSGQINGAPPPSFDLRYIHDGPGSLFDPVFNGFNFAVELTLFSRCNASSGIGQFIVYDAPAETEIGLQVNNAITGIPSPPSQDISSPVPVGIYSASFNLQNSSGDISYYQILIEEVNCSSGQVIAEIYSSSEIPTTTSQITSLTALALNALEINGNTGYFADPIFIGRCFRLEVSVGNSCGSSTDWTYITFDGAYLQDPDGRNERMAPKFSAPGPEQSRWCISFMPNPFHDEIQIQLNGPDHQTARLQFFDVNGRLLHQTETLPGQSNFRIDGSQWPDGILFYRLSHPDGYKSGKLAKQ